MGEATERAARCDKVITASKGARGRGRVETPVRDITIYTAVANHVRKGLSIPAACRAVEAELVVTLRKGGEKSLTAKHIERIFRGLARVRGASNRLN